MVLNLRQVVLSRANTQLCSVPIAGDEGEGDDER